MVAPPVVAPVVSEMSRVLSTMSSKSWSVNGMNHEPHQRRLAGSYGHLFGHATPKSRLGVNFRVMPTPGRFVLFLDILGFKQMIYSRKSEHICAVIEEVLKECDNWTSHDNSDFETIHFSDSIVLYTRQEGTSQEWYDDLLFVGARVCNRLLEQGIPVRGSMAFGDFLVKKSGQHLVYLGRALVDAHEAQDKKPYLG